MDAIRARRAEQGLSGSDAALAAALGAFAPVATTTAAAATAVAALTARISTPVTAFAATGISATLAAAVTAATMTTMAAIVAMFAMGAGRDGGFGGRAAEEGLQPAEEAARFRGSHSGGNRVEGAGRSRVVAVVSFARGATEVRRSRDIGVAGADVEEFLRDLSERDALLAGRTFTPLFAARAFGAGLAHGLEAFALPSLGGRDILLRRLEDVELGRLVILDGGDVSRCLLLQARDLS